MDKHNRPTPKGWIKLHILCYESRADKDVSELVGKQPETVFRPTLLQVSNIVHIDLDYPDDFLEEGCKTLIGTSGTNMEVQETYEQVLNLILLDQKKQI